MAGKRGSVLVASIVILAGACSDDPELSSREIQRAIGDLCADEVDARAEAGVGSWLGSAMDGDVEAALAAAAYNVEAMDRMAGEVGDLEAGDAEDAAALDLAVDGLEQLRGTWEDRRDRHESSGEELDQDAVVAMIEEDSPNFDDWLDALAHFDVVRRDCGEAVP